MFECYGWRQRNGLRLPRGCKRAGGEVEGLGVTDSPYGIELGSAWRDRAGLDTAPSQKRTSAAKRAKNNAYRSRTNRR